MNFLRQLFLNNVGLKAISLLLATLLWWQIASQETVLRTISVPVEFVNLQANLEISNDYPKQVEVDIQSQRSIGRGEELALSAVIDLKNAKPGTEIIPLTEEQIKNKPSEVEILSITPARIRLQLEHTLRKLVKVDADVIGKPAESFQINGIQVVPPEVLISGPESRVKKVSTARTEPISVEGRRGTLTREVYLDLEDPRLRIESTPSVSVIVDIQEKRKEVRLGEVAVSCIPDNTQAHLYTRSVKVIGTVPISFRGKIDPSNFRAVVDLSELKPQRTPYEVPVEVVVPKEYKDLFRVKAAEPSQVKVRRLK